MRMCVGCGFCFFLQAEDGMRDLGRSRGLGDVYKRQLLGSLPRAGTGGIGGGGGTGGVIVRTAGEGRSAEGFSAGLVYLRARWELSLIHI